MQVVRRRVESADKKKNSSMAAKESLIFVLLSVRPHAVDDWYS